ncbi:flippase-like domain-containing protein [Flaviflexus salsibiostraticola]|uniref:Flippase-like domain-containing protein n=1 Tax=Flaviflexus salsibiostraticola TaxID=1282737 RepID=A0A3Q8WWM3_9ACTO|nr:lysylphosphatidylglycerol synthase domain-containing protein [Flaviflexus salsibiostraticola]AZN30864.1 flippase-like domain-containing protein [Flaviflexus salsibiostraticola]
MKTVIGALRSPAFRSFFMVAAVAAAVWAVVGNWEEVSDALGRLSWWVVLLALVISFAFVWLTMLAWRTILNDAGDPVKAGPARRIFFVSQVAKYLPGGVWNFVAAAEMGTDYDISRRRSVTVLLMSMLVSVLTGLGLASIALVFGPSGLIDTYWWVLLVIPVLLIILYPPVLNVFVNRGLTLLKRDGIEKPFSGRAIWVAALWAAASWAVAGLQVWLILTGLGNDPALQTYLLTLGGYALAWVVGFLVFFVPAGVGVREVVLGASLAGLVPAGDVVVVVLLSRILFTIADLILGLSSSLSIRRSARSVQ